MSVNMFYVHPFKMVDQYVEMCGAVDSVPRVIAFVLFMSDRARGPELSNLDGPAPRSFGRRHAGVLFV